jgi:hypothetical protein
MVRLTVLAVSSALALGAAHAYAQPVYPVVPPVVHHHHDWRAHERERAYRHEQHRLRAEQRDVEAQRRALHEQHKFDSENGFYGR